MITTNRPWHLTLLFLIAFTSDVYSQISDSPDPFNSYYYDYKLANPAFTGTISKHVITTVYSGIPSLGRGAPEVLYGSYERNIESIKTGIGGLLMYDRIGAVSTVHAGLLYSKELPFNETSGLHFGTQVFYHSSAIDQSYFEFLGQDPLIVQENETSRNINLDLGVLYYSSYATIAASLKNVIQHQQETTPLAFYQEKTTLNLILTREFKILEGLKATPSLLFLTDFEENSFNLNSTFEIQRWILLGAGYTFAQRSSANLNLNVGLNIKDWVQIITHVYSSAGFGGKTHPLIETMIRVKIPDRIRH